MSNLPPDMAYWMDRKYDVLEEKAAQKAGLRGGAMGAPAGGGISSPKPPELSSGYFGFNNKPQSSLPAGMADLLERKYSIMESGDGQGTGRKGLAPGVPSDIPDAQNVRVGEGGKLMRQMMGYEVEVPEPTIIGSDDPRFSRFMGGMNTIAQQNARAARSKYATFADGTEDVTMNGLRMNTGSAEVMKKGKTKVVDKEGNGHPRVDTVPAILAEGEAVLNAAAAERMGRDNIKQLNKQGLRDMDMDDKARPVMKKGGRLGAFTGVEMTVPKATMASFANGTNFARTSPENDAEFHPTEYREPRDPEHDAEHMAQPLSGGGQGFSLRRGTEEVNAYMCGTSKVKGYMGGTDRVMKMPMKMKGYADGTSDAGGHGTPASAEAVNMAGTVRRMGMRGYAAGVANVPGETETELANFDKQRDRNQLNEAMPYGVPALGEPAGEAGAVTPSREVARMRQNYGLTAQGFAMGTEDVQAKQPAQMPGVVYAADGDESIFNRAKDLGSRAVSGLRGMFGGGAEAAAGSADEVAAARLAEEAAAKEAAARMAQAEAAKVAAATAAPATSSAAEAIAAKQAAAAQGARMAMGEGASTASQGIRGAAAPFVAPAAAPAAPSMAAAPRMAAAPAPTAAGGLRGYVNENLFGKGPILPQGTGGGIKNAAGAVMGNLNTAAGGVAAVDDLTALYRSEAPAWQKAVAVPEVLGNVAGNVLLDRFGGRKLLPALGAGAVGVGTESRPISALARMLSPTGETSLDIVRGQGGGAQRSPFQAIADAAGFSPQAAASPAAPAAALAAPAAAAAPAAPAAARVGAPGAGGAGGAGGGGVPQTGLRGATRGAGKSDEEVFGIPIIRGMKTFYDNFDFQNASPQQLRAYMTSEAMQGSKPAENMLKDLTDRETEAGRLSAKLAAAAAAGTGGKKGEAATAAWMEGVGKGLFMETDEKGKTTESDALLSQFRNYVNDRLSEAGVGDISGQTAKQRAALERQLVNEFNDTRALGQAVKQYGSGPVSRMFGGVEPRGRVTPIKEIDNLSVLDSLTNPYSIMSGLNPLGTKGVLMRDAAGNEFKMTKEDYTRSLSSGLRDPLRQKAVEDLKKTKQ